MKHILLFVILGMTFGCTKSGSGNSGTPPPPISLQSAGKFIPDTGVKMTFEEEKSEFTLGCKKQGIQEGNNEFDPRLRPGMIFTSIFTRQSVFVPLHSFQQQIQVISAAPLKQDLILKTSSVLGVDPSGLINKYSVTCHFVNSDFSCNYKTPQGKELDQPKEDTSNCKLVDVKFESFEKIKGKYILGSKEAIPATQITYKSSGTIVCGNNKMGPGTSTLINVNSNSYISVKTSSYCGGTIVFYKNTLKDGSGKVIHSSQSEEQHLPHL